ncbi:MAG: thioester dehydrase [Panacagrimonas sp.]
MPRILSSREAADRLSLDLEIGPELGCFEGHFDELPILPGVLQIDWAIRIGCQHWALAPDVRQLSHLKFMQVIRPGTALRLELHWRSERRELAFSFRDDTRELSCGRAVLSDV